MKNLYLNVVAPTIICSKYLSLEANLYLYTLVTYFEYFFYLSSNFYSNRNKYFSKRKAKVDISVGNKEKDSYVNLSPIIYFWSNESPIRRCELSSTLRLISTMFSVLSSSLTSSSLFFDLDILVLLSFPSKYNLINS